MKLKFDTVSRWLLFGGGPILAIAAEHLMKRGYSPHLICGARHLDEKMSNGMTFQNYLKSVDLSWTEVTDTDIEMDGRVIDLIDDACIGLSFDAPWIFRASFIDRFTGRLLNSHGSRLPQDRGGGGFSWRIMRGERLGYSILHQVAPKLDAGAVVAFNEYLYPKSCRIPNDYFAFALTQDSIFVKSFIDNVISGQEFDLISQPEYLSVYFPRLATDIHGFVDWSWGAEDIERFICAFDDPYRGASTFWRKNRVRTKKAQAIVNDGVFHPFQVGLIYRVTVSGIFVACNNGGLLIQEIAAEDGNSLLPEMRVGDRLYTPREHIETAQQFRAIYSTSGLLEQQPWRERSV
jgi:methionyl-tRNA formyltransferase